MRTIIVITFYFILGCAMASDPVTTVDSLRLTDKELNILEAEALKGSGMDAVKISNFYLLVKENKNDALKWALIAAENESDVGQYIVGYLTYDSSDPMVRLRAKYWLEKSSKNGNIRAKELLEEIEK